MDPLSTAVVVVLGKYALDKSVELGKEVGPKALDTAKEMFKLVLERVGQKKPEMAVEFPKDPEAYQKPLEKAVAAEAVSDPYFAARLKELLVQYEAAVKEYAADSSSSYQAVTQSGAVAQGQGNVAASGGSAAVGGDVGGNMILGPEVDK